MAGKSKIKNFSIGHNVFAQAPFVQSFTFDSNVTTFDSTLLTWDAN